MELVYPACFYPCHECSGYTIEFPDLPGCVTEGDSLADAIEMATDTASLWVLNELESGKAVPKASDILQVHPDAEGFVTLIMIDIDEYAKKYGSTPVHKDVEIPTWLNTIAEQHNADFSKILNDALMELYVNTEDE